MQPNEQTTMMQSRDIAALVTRSGVEFAQWPQEPLPAHLVEVVIELAHTRVMAGATRTTWGYLIARELENGRKQVALVGYCEDDVSWPGMPSCYLNDVIEATVAAYPALTVCSGVGPFLAVLESSSDAELCDCLLRLFEYGLLDRTIALSCYTQPATSLACPA